ncbi:MAG: hypothetical protein EXS16_07110 [Gemmataceae bacterium]|nr:hypothetical protein [Gemmataceae bacterium]
MKCVGLFVGGSLLFGAVAIGIGVAIGGTGILLEAGIAFALAFVPAAVTLAWVVVSYRSTPEMQLTASLGGSGVRMMIALGGGYLLTNAQAELFGPNFWYWILLFYLGLLAFEITLLVQRQPAETITPPTADEANPG